MRENVKHDDELEKLLDEIPQATSHNLQNRNRHVYGGGGGDRRSIITEAIYGTYGRYDDEPFTQIKYPCASASSPSPLSRLSLPSHGSSSSLFSSGYSWSDTGSPSLNSHKSFGNSNYPKSYWFNSKIPEIRKKDNGSMVDELGLCDDLRKMYISNQRENYCNFKDASLGTNGLPFCDCFAGNNPMDYNNFKRVQSPFGRSPVNPDFETNSAFSGFSQDSGFSKDLKLADFFGSQPCSGNPQLNDFYGGMDSSKHRKQMINNYWYGRSPAPQQTASLNAHPMTDTLPNYAPQNGVNLMQERSMSRLPYYVNAQNYPQAGLDAITSEDSFILQGESLNYINRRGLDSARSQSRGAYGGYSFNRHQRRSELDFARRVFRNHEIPRNDIIDFPLLHQYNSLEEAQGHIYLIAKDQLGCRFLQRMFDEGTPEDVQVIFNEIIDHVVELMVNPFGNYLMQKLLEVCTEQQRMNILLRLTEQPGQLVRISLNTHGTRVVQKLIETLKTRQQISLVISALEPGFLALTKDLNGNHVVHRCLQFLRKEDNKFIYVAATKYCIDIATHQHGCCVLQRCIGYSSGEHREKLVTEISSNALLLAQNQYGNYVVQFVLDLYIPNATENIISQFEGKYVHLSMEKFSSHVVEKCLAVFNDENRSRVIYELLTAPHFEQLLQDPHANYVIQSALLYSEGHVYNVLVDAIESHKAISRNSPYSKKIFSLLRK